MGRKIFVDVDLTNQCIGHRLQSNALFVESPATVSASERTQYSLRLSQFPADAFVIQTSPLILLPQSLLSLLNLFVSLKLSNFPSPFSSSLLLCIELVACSFSFSMSQSFRETQHRKLQLEEALRSSIQLLSYIQMLSLARLVIYLFIHFFFCNDFYRILILIWFSLVEDLV